MRGPVEVMIEPELMEALNDLSREQDTPVAELIRIALTEFIWSLEDDLDIGRLKQDQVSPC